jgi:uncharacterized protein YegP (UPF0339 family)
MEYLKVKNTEKGAHFAVTTKEGKTLLKSVAFSDQNKVLKNIREIKSTAHKVRFERRTNHKGEFVFELKNANGKLLGQSNPYVSEAGMENGIQNLLRILPNL